ATETAGALAEARRTVRIQKGEGVVGRTALTLEPVQVPDITVPGAHGGRLRDTPIESGVPAVPAGPMGYARPPIRAPRGARPQPPLAPPRRADRPAPDLRHPVGPGNPERPALSRDRGQERPTRGRQPA